MAEFLVIRIGERADHLAQWIAVDSTGARRSPPLTGPLSEAGSDIGDRQVIVLVPGTEVLTTSVDIPVKGGSRLHAALPYALEDQLAEDVDQLHFAAGTRRSSGRIPVAIVSRVRLAEWIGWLTDCGIQPSAMISDNYGLARIPGTISLLVAEGQVMINDGADVELVMQGVSPSDALVAIGALDGNADGDDRESNQAASPAMSRHVLVYCEAEDEEKYQHDWLAIRNEMESVDVNLLSDGVMPRLAVTVASGAGVNLLQGDFGARTEYAGLLRPWRYAAILLLALGVVGIAVKATDLYVLKRQEAELKQQFEAEYRQIAPGAPAVEDPTRLVASLRARLGTSDTPPLFLQSLEQLSRALQQNREARIAAISFRAGVVDIRLSAPNVSTLDKIQRGISESGQFEAAIKSTDQDGDGVSSRIQIKASGL